MYLVSIYYHFILSTILIVWDLTLSIADTVLFLKEAKVKQMKQKIK